MKSFIAIFVALSTFSTAYAADPVVPSAAVQQQVLALLKNSPAVKGAYAESKRWSEAKSCDALQIEEVTQYTFKVYASCNNPGDPKEVAKVGVGLGAMGQFHVTGTILYGTTANAPINITIDNIAFTNAG